MTGRLSDKDAERLQALLNTIPHIVWTSTPDGVRDFLNRRAHEELGISIDDFSGSSWLDLLHPDDRERARRAWLIAVETGDYFRIEYRIRGEGEGGYRWYLSQALPERDSRGEVRHWVGTWTDIDDLKGAEQEIRDSEARLRQIADNIQAVFWLTDPDNARLVYASPAYETIWGRSRESLYEDPTSWIEAIHPEDRDRVKEAARTRQESGEYDEVYRIVRPDGEVRWIRDRGFPVHDESGEVLRVTGVADDITERRRLEESLHQAQKIEAIGLLAGGIAHDFNNVLTAIRGNAEVALDGAGPDSPIREELEWIVASAQTATALTRQLLRFSRTSVADRRPVSLTDALEELVPMFRRLIPASIELEVETGEEPAVTIMEPSSLEQIVMNLLINARDAISGGGRIRIAVLRESGHVGLEVRDTGVGMDEETRLRAFEPLFTTKPEGKGTGLGLFNVRGIVDGLEGRIELESEPGRGTTFRIFLPEASEPLEATPDEPPASDEASGEGEAILVVEDNPAVAQLVEKILTRSGYDVVVVTDGAAALEQIESGAVRPDLVITDVVMPRMTGTELAERLRELEIEVPLLFTSGYEGNQHIGVAVTGRARFIEKPFRPSDLTRAVRALLDAPAAGG